MSSATTNYQPPNTTLPAGINVYEVGAVVSVFALYLLFTGKTGLGLGILGAEAAYLLYGVSQIH